MLHAQMVDEIGRQRVFEGSAVFVSRLPFLFLSALHTLPAFRVGDKLGECQLPAAGGNLDFEGVRKNPAPASRAVLRKVRVGALPCSQIASTGEGKSDTRKGLGMIWSMLWA
jgi:hypothetical protein